MKTISPFALLIIAMLVATSAARADRLPVDLKTRTVTTDHILLEVSDSQAEEMDTQDTLTLTTAQWQTLRKKGLMWPMRLQGIINYDDDTCGCGLIEGSTGIRLDEKHIAILPGYTETEDARQTLGAAREGNGSISLRVDRKGQFYAKGVLVPYTDVLSYFQEPAKPSDEDHPPTLWVNFPVGINRRSAAVKERVDQLEAAAKSSGWEVHIEKKATETASGT